MTDPRVRWRASICCVRLFLFWIAIIGASVSVWRPQRQVIVWAKQNRPTKNGSSVVAATGSSAGYSGSAACAHCHSEIYSNFSRTRMGRSITPVSAESLKGLPLPGSIYSAALDRHFDAFEKNGQLYQSEYQIGADGKEIFRNTQPVEWIIGAGANGFGGLSRRGNFLFEAPASYYQKIQHWDLSPGYESKDLGFNRPVLAGCISCHSGRPRPLSQTTGEFAPFPFEQTAIGCENCHGPGAAHIRAMRNPASAHGGSEIVNPSRLSADLENNICMSCHEAGDSRVLRPGKTYQDFRPGTPLDETVSILMVPRKRTDSDSDHVQHYYEMSMSQCFRSSAGQLRCATCHDPHVQPTAAEAPGWFNQKCMECHASHTCKESLDVRRKTAPADNCIRCHMPQRNVPETAHTSLTNHRIVAREGEPWPDAAFQQTTPALPDLVHVDRIPGNADDLPPTTLLEAYREISERKPEYLAPYRKLLDDLEQNGPEDASVQLALGRRDLQLSNAQTAIEHFQHTLQLNPHQPEAYGYLSEALQQRGRIQEAIAASEKGVAMDPFDPLLRRALIDQLIAAQQYAKATEAMESYLKDFPEDSLVRQMLAIAKQ
jgi:hypothetical protein